MDKRKKNYYSSSLSSSSSSRKKNDDFDDANFDDDSSSPSASPEDEWEDIEADTDDEKKRYPRYNPFSMGIVIVLGALVTFLSLFYFADVSHMNVVDSIHASFHTYHMDALSHSLPEKLYHHHISITDLSSSSSHDANAEEQALEEEEEEKKKSNFGGSDRVESAKISVVASSNNNNNHNNNNNIELQHHGSENIPHMNIERDLSRLIPLQTKADELINSIRQMKGQGVVMETDSKAKELISELQENLRQLIPLKYGEPPYILEMELTFPDTMPDAAVGGKKAHVLIELAPIEFVPYCVYYFLQVVEGWKIGDFHRNAGHVLQASPQTTASLGGLAFQEYHPSYPHVKFTMGYAGRPGGPAFYISTVDNSANHGPGSQGSSTEADGCFGRIMSYMLHNDNPSVYTSGFDVVRRMQKQPGGDKRMGFISGVNNYITIDKIRILTTDERAIAIVEKEKVSSMDSTRTKEKKNTKKSLPVAVNVINNSQDNQKSSSLQTKADELINSIRQMKGQGVVMETDSKAKELISELQENLRQLIPLKYGEPPYILEMELTFPDTMPDAAVGGKKAHVLIELAPIEFVPYCVYYFLQVVGNWKLGHFHRNAGHVLQAQVLQQKQGGLAFQEYHPSYPHVQYTLGYAGRPGGPAFYISTVDNSANHGPGSQGSETEADGCFGRIISYMLHNDNPSVYQTGYDVVERMQKQPGKTKGGGFIAGKDNFIIINSFTLVSKDVGKKIISELQK